MGLAVTSLAGAVVVSLAAGVVAVACGGPTEDQVSAAVIDPKAAPPTTVTTAEPRELHVGDTLPVGQGGSLAVLDVEADVNAGRLFNAPKGKEYFAAEVKACSGPTEKGLAFAPDFFLIEMEAGGAVVPDLPVKKPNLLAGKIPAGKCLAGWVTWLIPEGAPVASVIYNGAHRLTWLMPLPEGKAG